MIGHLPRSRIGALILAALACSGCGATMRIDVAVRRPRPGIVTDTVAVQRALDVITRAQLGMDARRRDSARLAADAGLMVCARRMTPPPASRADSDPDAAVPTLVAPAPPPRLSASERGRYLSGRATAAQSGCLACHQIGRAGNAGPGPDLGTIGARRTRAQLRDALLHPVAPMPSYSSLRRRAPRRFNDLLAFLAQLR